MCDSVCLGKGERGCTPDVPFTVAGDKHQIIHENSTVFDNIILYTVVNLKTGNGPMPGSCSSWVIISEIILKNCGFFCIFTDRIYFTTPVMDNLCLARVFLHTVTE